MSPKVSDIIVSGYALGSTGLGVGLWLLENWLAILSAVGIIVTMALHIREAKLQTKQHRMIEEQHRRKMERLDRE